LEPSNFTLHLADLPSDFPFLDVLFCNYIPKIWEEILFEAILLKFEKFGSIHSRDEARTTNTLKKWDVSWTSSSAANRAPEHDLHSNLLKLGPKLRFKLHPSWLTVNHPIDCLVVAFAESIYARRRFNNFSTRMRRTAAVLGFFALLSGKVGLACVFYGPSAMV